MTETDVAFSGVARQAELIREGEVSPGELVELYLERIGRLNPTLNSYRTVLGESARAEAKKAEARRDGDRTPPLLGVPIAVKDNQDVAGELTTHGTGCVDRPATEDSEMIRRLREAGAVVIGKTKLPELAYAMFTESDSWGITRNPWNTDRTPGGSSGGSGAAVAAGLAAGATASDGAGSIRYPASYCSLFGLKPQRGRVPLDPLIEHWHGMSVNGFVTQTVLDTALLLDATAGGGLAPDQPPAPERPFAEAARTRPESLRIAVSLEGTRALAPPMLDPRCRAAVEETAELLTTLGHQLSRRGPDWGRVGDGVAILYLTGLAEDAGRLPNRKRLGRQVSQLARLGSLVPDSIVRRTKAAMPRHASRINAIFEDVDVLMLPMIGEPPVAVGKWNSHSGPWTLTGMTRRTGFGPPWNYVGNPSASVPAGFTDDGLPLSVQLVGRPNDEATLLSLAAQLEAERPWTTRRPPVS
jgi:amidase